MTAKKKIQPKFRSHIRELIKAEEIIIMLQNNLLSPRAKPLNQNKLHAAKLLLAKALPDLRAMEITGEDGGPVKTSLEVQFVDSGVDADTTD